MWIRESCCTEDPRGEAQANSLRDETSIHYDFAAASPSDRSAYLRRLGHDLALRNLPVIGSTRVMQDLLKETLTKEYKLHKILDELRHGTINQATALYLVINALPCILHLENRVGLKILSRLLRIGMDHAKSNTVDDVASETDRIKQFITQVEEKMNSSVLGSEDRPIIWKCPYDADKKQVGTICLDNVGTRSVVKARMELVGVCIPAVADRDRWGKTIGYYTDAMNILIQHQDLEDEEIDEFQWKIDQFAQGWIEINMGKEGVSNYIHDLNSGHVSDYLLHWMNLYAHSQQSWAALTFDVNKYWSLNTDQGLWLG